MPRGDFRSAPRLALLFLGAVLVRGRRTVTSWIRAAKLSDQFRPCYTAVAAAGKKADLIYEIVGKQGTSAKQNNIKLEKAEVTP